MTQIERFPMHNAPEQCLPGMFNPFRDTVRDRIQHFREKGGNANARRVAFWEHVRDHVDPDEHARIQQKYLVDRARPSIAMEDNEFLSGFLKYIDPVVWLESKLSAAIALGLDKSAPLSILDIGTGGGHFSFVATYFGHEVIGVDLPEEVRWSATRYLYDDLCSMYGAKREPCRISPGVSLPDLGRFDLVTAFMAAFNATNFEPLQGHEGLPERQPWSVDDWRWFFREVSSKWTKPSARMFLKLSNANTPDDVWGYLESRAIKTDRNLSQVELQPSAYV